MKVQKKTLTTVTDLLASIKNSTGSHTKGKRPLTEKPSQHVFCHRYTQFSSSVAAFAFPSHLIILTVSFQGPHHASQYVPPIA